MNSTHSFLGGRSLSAAASALVAAAVLALTSPIAGASTASQAYPVIPVVQVAVTRADGVVASTGGSLDASEPRASAQPARSSPGSLTSSTDTGAATGPEAWGRTLTSFALDVIAILALVFGLYLPRHHRRDLVAAFLGVNVGVMAVSAALLDSGVSVGLGLGLFGVLSIIRLRSDELVQHEVAYYFSALALGLLGGVSVDPLWLGAVLMSAILLALWAGDNPRLLPRSRRQLMVLDRAFDHQPAMIAHLQERLRGTVQGVTVQKVDHVNDSTWVDVRFRLPKGGDAVPTQSGGPAGLAAVARPENDPVAAAGLNGHVRGPGAG